MWGTAASALDARHFLDVSKSVTGRIWTPRLDAAGERNATVMAQQGLASDILSRVLAGRAVSPAEAAAHLSPSLRQDLPDPSTFADMDAAAARLAKAVRESQPVAIFGDYDVDGATSAALLHDVLSGLGCPVRIYIPDRIFEGYGPNPAAIDALIDGGARLIVCVDCGSTSGEALDQARSRGVDVVVIDHHQVGSSLPPAAAIVNPNRQNDLSGQGHLAAVGVTFLVAVALLRDLRSAGHPVESVDLLSLLDLVALGTVCDVVPLKGVNRAFVTKGLLALRRGDRPGLRALAGAARLTAPPDCGNLGFLLGPRINAGGRIGDAGLGARLLTTRDHDEAGELAAKLDRLNEERRAIEADAVSEALAEAETEMAAGEGPAVLVTSAEGWHPGVVGLVAARLKERFCRPAIAIAFGENGLGTGSGRSLAGVDLGKAVRAAVAEGILVKGGGHAMAAGITIARGRLGELRPFLEAKLGDAVRAAAGDRRLDIDAALSAAGVNIALIEDLDRAGPFGTGNPAPVFAFPAHRLTYVENVGTGHLRIGLSSGSGPPLRAMAFRAADTPLGQALLESRGRVLHVAGTLSIDRYNGNARPSLRITDAAIPPNLY